MSSGRPSTRVAIAPADRPEPLSVGGVSRARVVLSRVIIFAGALALAACGRRDTPPQLLNLTDVTPRVIDASEAFEIQGSGLPAKTHAKVTLVGTLHHPGVAPQTNQVLELEGESSPTSITVNVPPGVRAQVLGPPDEGAHVTFRGSVQVAFAPVTPGALAITGSLADISLDIRPVGVRPSTLQARATEGERALKWLGISVTDEPAPSGGLVVSDVAEGSPAEAAGLLATDTIVSLDGLTLLDRGDVAPSGRERFSTVVVRHQGESTTNERLIALQGYKPVSGGNPDLLGAGLLLGAAALVILFFASPGAHWLTRLDRRIASHGAQRKAGRSLLAWAFERATSAWRSPASEVSISRSTLASAVFVALSALLSLLPFGGAVMGFEIDVGSIAAALLIVQVATHLVQWAQAPRGRRPSWIKTLFRSLLVSLPMLLSVACIAFVSSALHIRDLVRSQGGMPWAWAAFRSPMSLVLVGLLLFPALVEARTQTVPEALVEPTVRPVELPLSVRALQLGQLFLLSGVVSALFLGGWLLPSVDALVQEHSFFLQLAGASLLLIKAWSVVLVLTVLRATAPLIPLEHASGIVLKVALPSAAISSAASIAWMFYEPAPFVRQITAAALLAFVIALGVHLIQRAANTLRSTRGPSHANPFL